MKLLMSQVIYCRDKLGIPNELLNVNGGGISIGHPFGMSGARLVGQPSLKEKNEMQNMLFARCVLEAVWGLPACSRFCNCL